METATTEEWRDVKGYEGLYQVSNTGRMRSLDRTTKSKDGHIYHFRGHMLNFFTDPKGYYRVALSKNGKNSYFYVHRLVAIAFVPGYDPGLAVNHKDVNKKNNNASNLEWCSVVENLSRGNVRQERIVGKRRVRLYKIKLELVAEYESMREAHDKTGISLSAISAGCNNYKKAKLPRGNVWVYADD